MVERKVVNVFFKRQIVSEKEYGKEFKDTGY